MYIVIWKSVAEEYWRQIEIFIKNAFWSIYKTDFKIYNSQIYLSLSYRYILEKLDFIQIDINVISR